MGGRQAHGRAITAKALGKNAKKSKGKHNKNHRTRALDAYQLASEVLPDAQKKNKRHRNSDVNGSQHKHGREVENDEDLDQGPRRKKAKQAREEGEDDESDVEYGSDEEGNKWTMGAVGEDDDSEIDSDEAFGESDEERFEGFAFGGGKSKKAEVGWTRCGCSYVTNAGYRKRILMPRTTMSL